MGWSFLKWVLVIQLAIGLTMVTPKDWTFWRNLGLILCIWAAIGLIGLEVAEVR